MVSKPVAFLNIAAMLFICGLFGYCIYTDNEISKVEAVAPVAIETEKVQEQKPAMKVKELSHPEHLKELITQYEKDLKLMSEDQLAVMLTVADLTYDADLAYTAAAQIWTESEFGKYPVDLEGLSCGLGHKRMNFYVKENNLPDTSFSRNQQCSNFMKDHKLAIETYLKDFNYWRNYHLSKGLSKKEAYINAIKSYNAGKYVNSKDAKRYYDRVHARVIVLQKHFDFKVLVAQLRAKDSIQIAAN